MQFFFYLLFYPLILFLSLLPFRLLYLLSDAAYILIYKIFGYRKKTVRKNLSMVFPEKSEEERRQIEKKFYKHFGDLFVEIVKAFQMSPSEMQKRMKFKNVELLNKISDKNQNIILIGGHYGNWEWIFYLARLTKAQPIGTYLKINNKYIEKFILNNRKRFGGELVETKRLIKTLKKYKEEGKLFVLGLLGDQAPQLHRTKYWRKFLGIPGPVFVGPEQLAKENDAAVVFMKMKKTKRGFYEMEFVEITTSPRSVPDYGITDKYLELLEEQIREKPEYYLWTHNRFKHKDKLPSIKNHKKLKIKND